MLDHHVYSAHKLTIGKLNSFSVFMITEGLYVGTLYL